MTYTQLALLSVSAVVVVDLFLLRTRLVARKVFWVSYAIMFFFQLVTNGVLTGLRVVRYDGAFIVGESTPPDGPPPFFGEGRIAFAPVEDLLFGFGLILLTLSCWIWLGRRGVQREPFAGPPRWRRTGTGGAPGQSVRGSRDPREGDPRGGDQSGTVPGP